MKSFILATLLALFASQASAVGIANYYTVDFVRIEGNGYGYVQFTSPLVAPSGSTVAPCTNQADYNHALAFDTNTPAGRAVMVLVMQAKATGAKIYARGTGTCTTYSMVEQWGWGFLQ